jgi:predicted ATPase/class 3 adenylate cyclase
VIKCPSCGEENPPKFKLCGYCGTPLPVAPPALPAKEIRKTVTLLFTDLKDSTALGERLDSEALHEVKERYFKAMAEEIKRHGGKIEKYIGDAIMAVFGLPRAHEDDALRAVRAAVGMKVALEAVNADLSRRYGVQLANRTGVNTGEVVASDDPTADQKLATGDAVNVTARLEAAAPANEIYIGETTWRLVRDAVEVEPVEPLTLKGKSEPVPAFRLVKAHGQDGHVRRHDTPVVGREAEMATLLDAWSAATGQRRAQLVTVIGDAGVGKTRLVRELIERVSGEARVVFGRCLPYGDGITFWPLREMVVAAADIGPQDTPETARQKLLDCVRDGEVADRLASASGLGDRQFPLHEINWAARKLMQTLAANRPLLAMFDDIHWAEPAFLDLIGNLLETVDAPVLLLATARHDLLEERADWSQSERATRMVLHPLGAAAVAQVVANLLGSTGLGDDLIGRIVEAAEGNPLYVEQMLSMFKDNGTLRQDGSGGWSVADAGAGISVPPTIQALLEARLDKLERTERATAEPAAVIGVEFAQPAVASLAPAPVKDSIDKQLEALSRKQFIRPTRSASVEQAYRFHHHLVREAVYNGLLKRTRANFHVEFVRWADRINAESDRGQEFEAILGYHLEQAYRYLGELGPHDETGVAIGRDAARRLASAGRRAFARGDMHAARNLYQRAIGLLPQDDPRRAELLPTHAEVLMELGEFAEARATLGEALRAADQLKLPLVTASAQIVGMLVRLHNQDEGNWSAEAQAVAESAIETLAPAQADEELAVAYRLLALAHQNAGRMQAAISAIEQVANHARRAGNDRLVARSALGLALGVLIGPTPVAEALAQCHNMLGGGLNDRQVECLIQCKVAQLQAMNGDFGSARTLYRRARSLLQDLGQGVRVASTGADVMAVELLAGDLAVAEREARADYEFLERQGETYFLATMAAMLARVVRDQGRDDEALALTQTAEGFAGEDDLDAQVFWRSVRAPILARAGKGHEAETLAVAALELARKTEYLGLQADALFELAVVRQLNGSKQQARDTLAEACSAYRAKGDRVSLERAEEWGRRTLSQ